MPAESEGSRRALAAAALLTAGVMVAALLLALFPLVQRWSGDVRLFQHYASLAFSGNLGTTPFLSWYPPLALVPLGLPLLAGGSAAYTFALGAEMAVVAGGGAALVGRLGQDEVTRWRGIVLFSVLALAATALFAWRYDLVPAVLTLASAWACSRRRWGMAGALLGAAAGLKLYAAVLAPLLVVHAWTRGGGRAASVSAGAFGGVGLASVALYLLFPGSSPLDLLAFTANRPLQLETIPGSIIAGVAALGATTVEVRFGSGSFNLDGAAPDLALAALRILQPVVILASLAAGASAILRSPAEDADRALVVAWLAVLLGLIISNRVLSPQYVVWLLPLVPLVSGRLMRLLVAGIALTVPIFPWLYESLLELEALPVVVVLIRNVVLVMAWAAAILVLLRWPSSRPSSRAVSS